MINIDFKKEKGKIDEIINKALADYQNEINLINIDDWTLKSKELFIDKSYNGYSSQSTQFINTSFPDITRSVDSNARLILYLYTSERDAEFDLIKGQLIAKIKKSM
jgi:hypothetical protein